MIGYVSHPLADLMRAKSTTTDPFFKIFIWSSVIKVGAFLPGIKAVQIIISTSLHYAANKSISALINSGLISFAYPP